jgi:hypothetical protein
MYVFSGRDQGDERTLRTHDACIGPAGRCMVSSHFALWEAKASPSFHINMTLIIMRHRSHLVVFFLKSGISMTFHCPWPPHFLRSASNLSFVSCPMHAGLNHCNYSLMCGPTQNPITTLPTPQSDCDIGYRRTIWNKIVKKIDSFESF